MAKIKNGKLDQYGKV